MPFQHHDVVARYLCKAVRKTFPDSDLNICVEERKKGVITLKLFCNYRSTYHADVHMTIYVSLADISVYVIDHRVLNPTNRMPMTYSRNFNFNDPNIVGRVKSFLKRHIEGD